MQNQQQPQAQQSPKSKLPLEQQIKNLREKRKAIDAKINALTAREAKRAREMKLKHWQIEMDAVEKKVRSFYQHHEKIDDINWEETRHEFVLNAIAEKMQVNDKDICTNEYIRIMRTRNA